MNAVALAAKSVPLAQVEEEINRALLEQHEPGDKVPVRRARMSNLVIFCDNPERVAAIQQIIPRIVEVHPARVILAVHEPSDQETAVTASVHAWRSPDADKDPFCAEQITLRSRGRGGEHLVFAVRGLVIGDLPTNLWWTSLVPPALAGPAFNEAAEDVQQVIYDSNGWLEPARGVAATGQWIGAAERAHEAGDGWRVVSDVNWRRLKFWRRLLAQALDPNALPGALESITEVRIEHGPHAVVQAWLLVSWLASRLGWQVGQGRVQPGVEIAWQVQARHGQLQVGIDRRAEGPPEVRALRIRCASDGKPLTLCFSGEQPDRLTMTLEGAETAARTVTSPPQPLDDLIARQLSDRAPDPIFRDSMMVAQSFARGVLS